MSYLNTENLAVRQTEIEEEISTNDDLAEDDPMKLSAQGIEVLEAELAEIETIEGSCEDFRYGATLIPESEFEDYARELAEDIGAINGEEGWPLRAIDWKQAAKELAMDYTLVQYQGTDYYVR